MAKKLDLQADDFENVIKKTIFPAGKSVTNEQFVTFLSVASQYDLNPLTKEIYAFPAKGGGIQPIVSIDGWLKIINNHPQFDGVEFIDNLIDGQLFSVTCRIHRKDRKHPIEVTEYLSECQRNTEPWQKWPNRMLRHKALIQGGRYAFGFSGIIDEDEAERYKDAGVINKPPVDITPVSAEQAEEIKTGAETLGITNKIFEAYNINDFAQIPVIKYQEIKARINDFANKQSQQETVS